MNQQLQVISPHAAVPTSLYGKKYGGTLRQHLHVFALDVAPNQVRHLILGRNGEVVHNTIVLPDAMVVDSSIQDDHVLLLIERISTGRLWLVKVAENGEVEWEYDLHVHYQTISYPMVFVLDDVITLFWIAGDPATIQLSTFQSGNLKPLAALPLPDLTINLQVVPIDADLIVTRLVGASLTPQMLRIRKGQISHQVQPQDIATGGEIHILKLGKQLVALWQNHAGQSVYWQWLDTSLKPMSPPNAIYTTQQAGIRSFRAYLKPDDTIVMQVIENQPTGRMIPISTDRFQQAQNLVQQLFLTDGRTSTQPQTLMLQGSPYFMGGWIDERLYLLHGEMQPILSVIAIG